MSKVAFIWHTVRNLGDHDQEFRNVVFFDENLPIRELLSFLTSKDDTLELSEPIDPTAKPEIEF